MMITVRIRRMTKTVMGNDRMRTGLRMKRNNTHSVQTPWHTTHTL